MGLLAFVVLLGGIGSPASAPEPLPLRLDVEWIEAAPSDLPEIDSLWPVIWFAVLSEPAPDAALSEFHWPEFQIPMEDLRLPDAVGEKWEPYFTGRLELGLARRRRIDLETSFYPSASRAILGVPLGLLDALTTATVPDRVIVNGQQVLDQVSAEEDLATIMGRTLLMAELKFFASLRTSSIATFAAQNGTQDIDYDRFKRLQYRALFNATKNAYRERYQIPALDLDTILSSLSTGDWLDFVTVPAVVSVYAARFGIDRKIRLHENVRVELQIEKATRIYEAVNGEKNGGRLVSISVNLFKWPASAIVVLEAEPGGVAFGFVGIGTDINAALCVINGEKGPHGQDRNDR